MPSFISKKNQPTVKLQFGGIDMEKSKQLKYYYKNRNKRLKYYHSNKKKRTEYQKEYDKNNKDRKRLFDQKRWPERRKKNILEHYSRRNYFDILFKIYNGCQICKSKNRLEIHHKNYTKDIQDCMLVCQKCHKKIHSIYNKDLCS